jgi:predicted NUDIX family NTP pyrophosphohydrolase
MARAAPRVSWSAPRWRCCGDDKSVPKESAGLLLFRRRNGLEVFLVHPGGPFWARKDEHAWSIPKGELDSGEDPLSAARREFAEETGLSADGDFIALAARKQSGGKVIHAFAIEGDCDPAVVKSNTFELEWPPRSGRRQEFPEVDRAAWFPLAAARTKIHKGQAPLIDELERILSPRGS